MTIDRTRATRGLIACTALVACTKAPERREMQASTDDAGPIAVGSAAPVYQAVTLAGDSVTIGRRGVPITLLNVWATWCTSCREEMADLQALAAEYRARGLRVVAVSVDAGSETLVRRFVDSEHLTLPIVHDQSARVQTLYHVTGVPSSYIIDSTGVLRWSRTGGIHGSTDVIKAALAATLR